MNILAQLQRPFAKDRTASAGEREAEKPLTGSRPVARMRTGKKESIGGRRHSHSTDFMPAMGPWQELHRRRPLPLASALRFRLRRCRQAVRGSPQSIARSGATSGPRPLHATSLATGALSSCGGTAATPRLCGHPASLTFNMSHTGGIAFAAPALCVPLGVDAEIQRAKVDWMTISKRYFAPAKRMKSRSVPSRCARGFRAL